VRRPGRCRQSHFSAVSTLFQRYFNAVNAVLTLWQSNLLRMFLAYDSDGSGTVTYDEFRETCRVIHPIFTPNLTPF